jgi:hypothetical protein
MMSKDEDSDKQLTKLQQKMKAIGDSMFSDPEYLKRLEEMEKVATECPPSDTRKQTDEAKCLIEKRPPPPEQLLFSFMPTRLTRTSPFFPMSKRDMKNRPYEELEWETSWGIMRIDGKRLSIYDESVLLSLLVLVKIHKTNAFETTQNELCKIAKTHKGKDTYNAIWQAIRRLARTNIDLEIMEGKGKDRKCVKQMTGPILTFGDRSPVTGKLKIIFNMYFLEMYAASFITILDLEFRASLKGDIAKALYRFYISHRDQKYSCHVQVLANAVNINTDLPLRRIRERIRGGNRELKEKGFLTKHLINKHDIVTVWKSKKH